MYYVCTTVCTVCTVCMYCCAVVCPVCTCVLLNTRTSYEYTVSCMFFLFLFCVRYIVESFRCHPKKRKKVARDYNGRTPDATTAISFLSKDLSLLDASMGMSGLSACVRACVRACENHRSALPVCCPLTQKCVPPHKM